MGETSSYTSLLLLPLIVSLSLFLCCPSSFTHGETYLFFFFFSLLKSRDVRTAISWWNSKRISLCSFRTLFKSNHSYHFILSHQKKKYLIYFFELFFKYSYKITNYIFFFDIKIYSNLLKAIREERYITWTITDGISGRDRQAMNLKRINQPNISNGFALVARHGRGRIILIHS